MPLLSRLPSRRIIMVLAVLLVAALPGSAPAPSLLGDRIDALLDAEHARSAIWGVYVQDPATGRVLYERNADIPLMPASNQKLLTTATALDALGAAFRYRTTLYLIGTIDGTILRGDLVIEGSGDPSFGSREVEGPDPLDRWAQELADRGVTRIEGRIIGDDDVFDDDAYAAGWDIHHVATASFAPARGGLAYHDNVVNVRLEATRAGQPVTVQTDPPGYLEIVNQTTTSGRRRGPHPRLDRPVGTETLRLSGMAAQTYRGSLTLPVSNPTAFTLHAFRQALQAAGIEVAATLHDIDDLTEKPGVADAQPLSIHESPPLSDLIRIVNKESNNLYAEQLFHTFGWGGTSEGGARRVHAFLDRLGVPAYTLSVRDGSGLSRKDLVPAAVLGQLLTRMADHPEHEAFEASLAGGGEHGTTLRYRLRTEPVRGKTGSLEYVRALSGYTASPDGRTLAFSILANNYTAPSYRINRTIDAIVHTLATTQTD